MSLVLLPGMNCSPTLWQPVVSHLTTDADVISVHLEGTSIDECVSSLLGTLPERFSLAGLSLGGIVAMALIRRARDRVERLCLLDTNARPPTEAQRRGWSDTLSSLAEGQTSEDVQRQLLPALLSPAGRESSDVVSSTLAMSREVGSARLGDQLRMQQSRIDERPGLPSIDVPTWVVGGGEDALCPPERHEEIAGLVPRARLVLHPGVGHLSPLEAPELIAGDLDRWLGA